MILIKNDCYILFICVLLRNKYRKVLFNFNRSLEIYKRSLSHTHTKLKKMVI